MRVPKSRLSPVFDIIHPNCGEQLRKIFYLINKIDTILRQNYENIYPDKIEFSKYPKEINDNIIYNTKIQLRFMEKEIDVEPPYGLNFYAKYSKSLKYIRPINKDIKILFYMKKSFDLFIDELIEEIKRRNRIQITYDSKKEIDYKQDDINKYDIIITISDKENINDMKKNFICRLGIPHQNITYKNANSDSIQQLSMQITLKLGGIPWLIKSAEEYNIITIYSYRNPFDPNKFYLYNISKSDGELIYQSQPFKNNELEKMFDNILSKNDKNKKTILILSNPEREINERITDEMSKFFTNMLIFHIIQNDNVRIFSTFKPQVVRTTRRRRLNSVISYPLEAYEAAPQGVIFIANEIENYLLTTTSTKVGTYHRGCPTVIKLNVLKIQGEINKEQAMKTILDLCLASSTSGHGTRLPSSLYYLQKYAQFINNYSLPEKEEIFGTLFYV
jgi:hypothetical protein